MTITELTTIPNPHYLFEFIHEQSLKSYFFVDYDMPNISNAKERYDEFLFIDGGTFEIEYLGSYIYNVYQQTDPFNLDPTLTQGLVETGRAEVVDAPAINNFYESPITFEIYE